MLDASIEDDLVDVAVEGRVRQASELIHASPVVVFLLGPFAQSVVVAVFPGQDTCATSV